MRPLTLVDIWYENPTLIPTSHWERGPRASRGRLRHSRRVASSVHGIRNERVGVFHERVAESSFFSGMRGSVWGSQRKLQVPYLNPETRRTTSHISIAQSYPCEVLLFSILLMRIRILDLKYVKMDLSRIDTDPYGFGYDPVAAPLGGGGQTKIRHPPETNFLRNLSLNFPIWPSKVIPFNSGMRIRFCKISDPGLCTPKDKRSLKYYKMKILDNFTSVLFCFHTFGVRRSL